MFAVISIFLISVIAFSFSTVTAGGSPFILVPALSLLISAQATAPVITIAMLAGNSHRTLVFRDAVNWPIIAWYTPTALIGGILGAFFFANLNLSHMNLILGIGTIASVTLVLKPVDKPGRFQIRAWHFLPIGFFYAFLSAILGSVGSILTPLCLAAGLERDDAVGTRSVQNTIVHVVKLVAYGWFGVLNKEHIIIGLLVGLCAIPGNHIGQNILHRINPLQFRLAVASVLLISGGMMILRQLNY